jgi:hypothetical protein
MPLDNPGRRIHVDLLFTIPAKATLIPRAHPMKPGLFAAVVVAVFLLGFGVGRSSVTSPGPAAAPVAAPFAGAPSSGEPPSSGMGMGMGSGMNDPALAAAHPAGNTVTGVIEEVIQVPNYTYLRLKTAAGDEWAAVNSTTEAVKGQPAVVAQASLMTGFASSTLKRTFDRIWFGQLQGASAGGPPPAMGGMPPPAMGGMMKSAGAGATAGAIAALEKAQGPLGLRVSDVYAERAALNGRTVRVKGKVSKLTAVQGLNYLHLKDGSGTAAAADDDLVVVTKATVKAEDVVTLEGTVAVDKDYGAGARPVVLDDAKVVQ